MITQLGLSYLGYVEQKRHNEATEQETYRSNVAKEAETARSNMVREAETERSNRANEDIKLKQLQEDYREFNLKYKFDELKMLMDNAHDLISKPMADSLLAEFLAREGLPNPDTDESPTETEPTPNPKGNDGGDALTGGAVSGAQRIAQHLNDFTTWIGNRVSDFRDQLTKVWNGENLSANEISEARHGTVTSYYYSTKEFKRTWNSVILPALQKAKLGTTVNKVTGQIENKSYWTTYDSLTGETTTIPASEVIDEDAVVNNVNVIGDIMSHGLSYGVAAWIVNAVCSRYIRAAEEGKTRAINTVKSGTSTR